MTKPANLEYAFPGIWSGSPEVSVLAYRVVGGAYVPDPEDFGYEMDASLLPGFDYFATLADGDGSVGQYVVFTSNGTIAGFDPFDPVNHTPTTVRYWELQPGSDVMATTLGVLPKVLSDFEGNDWYMGLVTVAGGTIPADVNPGDGTYTGWNLFSADMPMTEAGVAAESATCLGEYDTVPPGVYVAGYFSLPPGGPPPYTFPEGWTSGNTTGSGPVLPLVAVYDDPENAFAFYAGHVIVAQGAPAAPADRWFTIDVNNPLTYEGLNFGTGYQAGADVQPGLRLAVYNPPLDDPAPTTLPAGWTFRPYGIGPIAITDENAGGVIGDIAYVVSGYVYNGTVADAVSKDAAVLDLPISETIVVEEGDYVRNVALNIVYSIIVAGDLVTDAQGGYDDSSTAQITSTSISYWPYLERYDLKNKTWLPRVPLPNALMDVPLTVLGAWDIGHGEYDRGSVVTESGKTWIAYRDTMGVPSGGLGYWIEEGAPFPYASEGGIAGVINGKLYFGGGDGDNITGTEFFSYDPATNEFERLENVPSLVEGTNNPPDYSPYGIVGGKLYVFGALDDVEDPTDRLVVSFDPLTGEWSTDLPAFSGTGNVGDQIQGVEIGGKLYFVYDRVYVFDPVALTVEVKGASVDHDGPSPSWLSNGSLHALKKNAPFTQFSYTTEGVATIEDVIGNPSASYAVTASKNNIPYLLSGVHGPESTIAGVYGLTGNQPIEQGEPVTTPNPAYSDPTLETGRFSGLYPDNTYPEVDGELDEVQEMKLQARQESERTPRESSEDPYADHPPFTEKYTTNDHALRRQQEEEANA